jgi:hypothetical protein
MLPRENSLTYFNDLVQHYREVDRRIAAAPFKPKPPKPQFRPVEPPPPEPEPEPELPDALEAAFADLGDALTAAILAPHPCTRIINETALEHGISREELLSPNRTLRVVRIRQLAMWRCRQAGVSLPTIGRYFGNRDHTTVMHAVRKIEAEMKAEEAS